MEVLALLVLLLAINIHYPRKEGPARIKRRTSGIPIIDVTFNGKQKFEMMLDTGASGTVITPKMANALRVKPVGKIKATIADGKQTEFLVGFVDSIEAGGVKVTDVPVAIGGSDANPGLLGQDFFGDYEIRINPNSNVIEFRG